METPKFEDWICKMSLYAPLRLVLLFWYKLNAVENGNRCSESWRSKHLSAVSAPEALPASWLLCLITWLLKITAVSGTTRKQKILWGAIHEKTAAERRDLKRTYKVKRSPKASRIPGLFILVLACSVFHFATCLQHHLQTSPPTESFRVGAAERWTSVVILNAKKIRSWLAQWDVITASW